MRCIALVSGSKYKAYNSPWPGLALLEFLLIIKIKRNSISHNTSEEENSNKPEQAIEIHSNKKAEEIKTGILTGNPDSGIRENLGT